MNNNLKIKNLREKGCGYKKIAKELSMTPSAVRYACQKLNNKDTLISTCKNCGKEIKSIKGKKKKLYCSDKCRWQWWNEQRRGESNNDTI